MSILAFDLGGTKLAIALFSESGEIISQEVTALNNRTGAAVGDLIIEQIRKYENAKSFVQAIGVSVPGISRHKAGTVWAPNIPGWDNYPLLHQIKQVSGNVPVSIDNDRACCIFGEQWQGKAKDCTNAIFLTVGTGIGAGILVDGKILRGADDIAGAVGWMALRKPYEKKYIPCGCFEYYASGDGIAKLTREFLNTDAGYKGILKGLGPDEITAHHVFTAFDAHDPVAIKVIGECIEFWGMAAANLVSIFNPEKIIFGGGVFGPATKFISHIKVEATKWAQPISAANVSFEKSGLHGNAGIYGAGFLALKSIHHT